MDGKTCKSLNDIIQEEKFQNLVKGVQVLNTARKALLDVNEKEWTKCIERLPVSEKHQLSTFLQCFEHMKSKTNTKSYQLECGHPNCSLLYTRLKNLSVKTNTAAELDVENLLLRIEKTSTYFDSSITWDFVKCFIIVLDMKEDVSLFKSKSGITLLIKLMKNCKLFEFEDSDNIYDQILEDTDTLIYSQDLHISNDQLGKSSDNLLMLLEHWRKEFRSCEDAIKDINKTARKTTDCESDEFKLLVKNVLEIVDDILYMEESKTEENGSKVNTSRELISSLLEQMNETPFVMQEQEDESESLQKNEVLNEDIEIIRTKLDSMETLIEENHYELTELKEENQALKQEMLGIQIETEILENELAKSKQENKTLEEENQKIKVEIDRAATFIEENHKITEENKSLKHEILEKQMETERVVNELAKSKQENKTLEEQNQKIKDDIDRVELKLLEENESLKQKIKNQYQQLISETRLREKMGKCICIERLKSINMVEWNSDNWEFQQNTSTNIGVTSFGSFQNILVRVGKVNILFDPFDANLFGCYDARSNPRFNVDVVVLSSCMYTFTKFIVKEIKDANPAVKWIVPHGRIDTLIYFGVDDKSITEFRFWDEKRVLIGWEDITFVCTPTKRKITSKELPLHQCDTCGWIIKAEQGIFFSSGFTNFNENFAKITKKYSPIDVALLPITSRCRNMSCSPEFKVEIDEILEMHKQLQPCTSLGIDNQNYYGEDQESILNGELEEMNLDCKRFHFMYPGMEYP